MKATHLGNHYKSLRYKYLVCLKYLVLETFFLDLHKETYIKSLS